MNREQLKKSAGKTLRLQPQALGPRGEARDDDWTLRPDPSRDNATLTNVKTGGSVVVGFDHIHSYMSDPGRGDNFGFLQMLSQVRINMVGQIRAEPVPPRPTAPVAPRFNGHDVAASTGAREMARRLVEQREYGIDHLLNRRVGSPEEQEVLDRDRQTWLREVLGLMKEADCNPSDLAAVGRLGTCTPQNLPALVDARVGQIPQPEREVVYRRNEKHRTEMAERLDRLLKAIKNLERRS